MDRLSQASQRTDENARRRNSSFGPINVQAKNAAIDKVYSVEDALEAYDHLYRGAFGKIIIRVRDSNRGLSPRANAGRATGGKVYGYDSAGKVFD